MKMQNLKRLCAVVLTVLMIVSIVPTSVFAAECKHEYEIKSWLKEATCTVNGIAKETCKLCGDTKYASKTLPHTEGEPKLLPADCANPDRISVVCSVCGTELTKEAVEGGKAALGCDWDYKYPASEGDTEEVKKYYEPTCEKEGYGIKFCKRCDPEAKKGEDSAVPAYGKHTFAEAVHHDVTCTEDERWTETCTRCGFTQNAVVEGFEPEMAKGEHTFGEAKVVAATCATKGYTERICKECGFVEKTDETEINPDAHIEVRVGVVKEPTCTANGVGKFTCSNKDCDRGVYYKTIPADHTWGEPVITEATCGKDGSKVYTCTVEGCKGTKTEKIPATGKHDFKDDYKEATCDAPAMAGEICTVCGATNGKLEEFGEALGHDFQMSYTKPADDKSETVWVAPTCEKEGYGQSKCTVCGATNGEPKKVDALGHKYVDQEGEGALVEPTCETGAGIKTLCERCGAEGVREFTENDGADLVVPATGHCETEEKITPATCQKDGLKETICKACGKKLSEEVIAKGEHHEVLVSTLKAPTCTASGVGKYDCDVEGCDKAPVYKTIPADHVWGEPVVTEATCGKDGSKVYTCTVEGCKGTKTEKIPATEKHTYEDTIKEATCTENAVVGEICSVCGATGKVEVLNGEGFDKLGHTEAIKYPAAEGDTDTVKKYYEPTCDKEGVGVIYCTVCDAVIDDNFTVPANKHDYKETGVVYTEATCAHPAGVELKCDLCGDVYVDPVENEDGSISAPKAHTEEVITVAATCQAEGYKVTACKECKTELSEREVLPKDANAHAYGEPILIGEPATCSKSGVAKFVCPCGNVKYTTIKLDHTWGEEVYASCDSTFVYNVCTACGEINILETFEGYKEGSKPGHTEVEIPAVEATCTTVGSTAGVMCSKCEAVLVAPVEVPVIAHTEEIIPAVEATCTATGLTEGKKCSVCGEELLAQEEIEMLAHTEEVVAGKAATCTETGLTEGKVCSVCGTVIVKQEEIPALGHKEEIIPAVAATCTATGLTEGKKCSVCGEELLAQEEIAKLEHKAVEVESKDATCTEAGVKGGTVCEVCDEILTADEVIEALGHKEEIIPAVAATCTATGLTEGKKCSVCGEILVAQTIIEKLAHTEETVTGYAATCTASGLTDGKKCSVCGEITVAQEEIPAGEHNYVYVSSYVHPAYGYTMYKFECTECGKGNYQDHR